MTIPIYISKESADVKRLHQEILDNPYLFSTVTEQLVLLAENLFKAHAQERPEVRVEFSNGHPDLIGKDLEDILSYSVKLEDAQCAIARTYGFVDWDEVLDTGDLAFDPDFEQAVDFLLTGQKEALKDLLQSHPHLLNQSSVYGHKAKLIHYAGSNGVEIWRQVVPQNLVELLEMLCKMGANPNANHNIYGGQGNLAGLIESSAHPWEAGIGKELLGVLG